MEFLTPSHHLEDPMMSHVTFIPTAFFGHQILQMVCFPRSLCQHAGHHQNLTLCPMALFAMVPVFKNIGTIANIAMGHKVRFCANLEQAEIADA